MRAMNYILLVIVLLIGVVVSNKFWCASEGAVPPINRVGFNNTMPYTQFTKPFDEARFLGCLSWAEDTIVARSDIETINDCLVYRNDNMSFVIVEMAMFRYGIETGVR